MPRAQATDVVIHRIELGGKEREMAEGVVAAFQFNRIANPIVAALSDVSFLVFVGGILAAYKFIDEDTWKALTGGLDSATTTAAEVVTWGEESYRAAQRKYREAGDLVDEAIDPANLLNTIFNYSPWGATFNFSQYVAEEVTGL